MNSPKTLATLELPQATALFLTRTGIQLLALIRTTERCRFCRPNRCSQASAWQVVLAHRSPLPPGSIPPRSCQTQRSARY
ncbi:MAG: hypothetical protein MZV49_18215 [Rhodopseudomonas palustris]|nr:hypothetical protein [Rhodopseudomonas palustris]